jgi:2-polyprenyl-6-methoxyphenol hydroxylase-like FAD-dependent oxidoreductase
MACVSSALIVGGGIAGLSLALALGRQGVVCEVLELSDAPLGASLGISGRAAETLVELGVYDAVHDTGTPFTAEFTGGSQNDAEGRLISPGPQRPQWPGSKTAIGVYRPVFLQILEDAARSAGAIVRRGLTLTALDQTAATATARLSDGTSRTVDLVVGADGIGSAMRPLLFPEAPAPQYAGQTSIRWMSPGARATGEGWYIGPVGRIGFYNLPQGIVYVPAVINRPWSRLDKAQVYDLFKRLVDSYTAPAVVELRKRLAPDSDLICRPFDWLLLPPPWHNGRAILIGDAAHATSAHMGMGGGMALEDSVVLAQCVAQAATLEDAFAAFMARRFERVRLVVETSVQLSRLEQAGAPRPENIALMMTAFQALSQPY